MAKKKSTMPTKAENDRINKGIRQDADNPEWTDDDVARAHAAHEALPADLHSALLRRRRGHRGAQKSPLKKQVTLRLDPDVIAHFKSSGAGWQSRLNNALRKELER